MWEIQADYGQGWTRVDDTDNYQDVIMGMRSWQNDNPGVEFRIRETYKETDELPYDIIIRYLGV